VDGWLSAVSHQLWELPLDRPFGDPLTDQPGNRAD
jgi:hypothetical protein